MAPTKEHAQIRAALERYSKEELVDLMEHLIRLYVLNEPVNLDSALTKPETLRELTGYSFSQVMSFLKSTLDLEELDQFRVSPITTYVNIGGMELDLNGPAPTLSAETAKDEDSETDDDDLSPAERHERMQIDAKPWRSAPAPKMPVSKVETPSMAELFTDDKRDRSYIMFDEAPTAAEEEDAPPPIAESAPGDDPKVETTMNDFAKAAASRDEEPATPAKASQPPELAPGDKQIDPSNRFAMLDLD